MPQQVRKYDDNELMLATRVLSEMQAIGLIKTVNQTVKSFVAQAIANTLDEWKKRITVSE